MMNFPLLVFVVALVTLWASARAGFYIRQKKGKLQEDAHADLSVVLGAVLTLLGLLIGFTFSMAISRYDQRKNYEAEEANAIGTEYARAGLLPPADAARVRELLRNYTDQRILFYVTRDSTKLQEIDTTTTRLQNDLWSVVENRAGIQPTPIVAVAIQGMNDVLNSQAYTLAAWWNRIPVAAWALMAAIALCCNYLVGYTAHVGAGGGRFFVLALIVSISFFLIADIDSPRGGVIRVQPPNLHSVAMSMRAP
jgi:hypothetical protein